MKIVENGILKSMKLSKKLRIDGCEKVGGIREENDSKKPSIIYESCDHIGFGPDIYGAFNNNDVVEEITTNAKIIGEGAFMNCSALKEAYLNHGVEKILMFAFGSCYNLHEVVIPPTVKFIDYEAFVGCDITLIIEGGQKQIDLLNKNTPGLSDAINLKPIEMITLDQ